MNTQILSDKATELAARVKELEHSLKVTLLRESILMEERELLRLENEENRKMKVYWHSEYWKLKEENEKLRGAK